MQRIDLRRGALTSLATVLTLLPACEGSLGEPSYSDRQVAIATDGFDDSTTTFDEVPTTFDDPTFDVGTVGESTGGIDICDDLEDLPACGGEEAPNDCVPRALYGKVAAKEYFNECRNYCHADDMCFDRAVAMLGELDKQCDLDLRGADGAWCGELTPPDSTGTCDDLTYKVIIRYPLGETWTYHIATLVKTCEEGMCVIDPLGAPASSPTTSCVSPQDWCDAHAHGDTVEWADTDTRPPAGKVYCEIAPGNQLFWDDASNSDPTDPATVAGVCKDLKDHVDGLCARGLTPYPPNCAKDADGDGIPDDYDKCPGTAPGAEIDFCDKDRLGCSIDQTPPEEEEETGTTEDTGAEPLLEPVPVPVPVPDEPVHEPLPLPHHDDAPQPQ